jgi:type IV secretion system protein VirD4
MAEGMKTSCNYNPFAYLNDSNGDFAPNNVMKMITALLQNTKAEGSSSGDQFWEDATTALLTALSFYLVETQEEQYRNFSSIMDLLKEAEVKDGDDDFKSDLDLRFADVESKDPNSLAVKFYKDYKKSAGDTAKSILISCSVRLKAFNMPDVANLTHCDTIDISTIGDKKTAVFLIIPSTDTTFNFIVAMFYSQLFDILYDRANFKYGGRLPVHVRCILDEFANIGKIPEFEKKLATMRSMEISANCIFQNVSQLKKMYEKSWQELIGNCDTRLLLGASDTETLEYFSKALGKETIDTRNSSQSKGKNSSNSTNDGAVGRELLTPDEIEVMDTNKCIVMVRNHHPFLDDKFKLEKHRNYIHLEDFNPRNAYLIQDIHTKQLDVQFPNYKQLQETLHTEPVEDSTNPQTSQLSEGVDASSNVLIEEKQFTVESVEFPVDISKLGILEDIPEELMFEDYFESPTVQSLVLIEPLNTDKLTMETISELSNLQDVEDEEDFFNDD